MKKDEQHETMNWGSWMGRRIQTAHFVVGVCQYLSILPYLAVHVPLAT